jgi:hypothetical protein
MKRDQGEAGEQLLGELLTLPPEGACYRVLRDDKLEALMALDDQGWLLCRGLVVKVELPGVQCQLNGAHNLWPEQCLIDGASRPLLAHIKATELTL